jgi:hypothetical protein
MQKHHFSIFPKLNLTALKDDKSKNPTALKVRFTSKLSVCEIVQQPALHTTLF